MIRYDKQLNADIRRTVANFNAKVKRLEQAGAELIPDKISTRELKDLYTKRYELKRKLKELQRFSERGVEEVIKTEGGVYMTKYALDNLKREVRRSQYRLTREANRIESQMGSYDLARRGALNLALTRKKLLSKDLTKVSKKEIETIKTNINRILDYDNQSAIFQKNLIQMLISEGTFYGVPQDIIDSIEKQLLSLTPEQLFRIFNENPRLRAITDYYPNEGGTIESNRLSDILKELNEMLPQIIAEFEG